MVGLTFQGSPSCPKFWHLTFAKRYIFANSSQEFCRKSVNTAQFQRSDPLSWSLEPAFSCHYIQFSEQRVKHMRNWVWKLGAESFQRPCIASRVGVMADSSVSVKLRELTAWTSHEIELLVKERKCSGKFLFCDICSEWINLVNASLSTSQEWENKLITTTTNSSNFKFYKIP